MKGLFITFEGIEGCGKTTQARLLAKRLEDNGYKVVLTREPGGTVIGDKIRSILLNAAHMGITPVAELFLYAAARNQHIAEVIKPAVLAGKIVLCDRYADATEAYQGAARRIDMKVIERVHEIATGNLKPRLTLLLDIPPEEGLKRAKERNAQNLDLQTEDRFERENMKFHKRVREGYLAIAKKEPDRVCVVNATGDIQNIHEDIWDKVSKLCGKQ